MTRKKFLIANWKMNLPKEGIGHFFEGFQPVLSSHKVVIAPSFGYLSQVKGLVKPLNWALGAQHAHGASHGAYTGEMSLSMLKDLGCEYVILGHSERRSLFGETSESVAHKTQAALDKGLIPVVCIGESFQERQAGRTMEVLIQQLSPLRTYLNESLVLAYEPVWAIGTNLAASPDDAGSVHQHLREHFGVSNLSILYGGSVKPENFGSFLANNHIDGALVGGASLEALGWNEMIQLFM